MKNQRMRKWISLALCLCMLAQNVPFRAAATEPAVPETTAATEPAVPETTAATEPAVPETTAATKPAAAEDSVIMGTTRNAVADSAVQPCTCGTDDASIHATYCGAYIAPENPVCYCVEKCAAETQNFWCDVCGVDYAKCSGTDTAVRYGTGWEILQDTSSKNYLKVTGTLTALPVDVEYSSIEVHEGGNLNLGTTEVTCNVHNNYGGTISSGIFYGVHNQGTISGGTFKNAAVNDGTISGGSFRSKVENNGTITDVTFSYGVVSNSEYGTIRNAKFESRASLESGSTPPESVIHCVNGKDIALTYNAALPAALGTGAAAWYEGSTQVTGGTVPLNYTTYVGEYKISTADATGGTVSVPATAKYGQTVTITTTPADGYLLDTLTVMNGENEVGVAGNAFTMPAGAVTVSATFTLCDHGGSRHETASDTGDGKHSFTCTLCGNTVTELHSYVNSKCVCGVECAHASYTGGKCDGCGKTAVYTVTLNSNGGTIDYSGSLTQTVEHGKYVSWSLLPNDDVYKTGYTCNSFNTQPDGSGESYYLNYYYGLHISNITSDLTLYADFKPVSFKIAFAANGGEGRMDTMNVTYDDGQRLPESTFTRVGYEFNAWRFVGRSSRYSPGYDINIAYRYVDKNTNTANMEAYWEPLSYTVTWDADGVTSTTRQTYDAALVLPAAPTRTGYRFTGWFTEREGGEPVTEETVYKIPGETTYYAQWQECDHTGSQHETASDTGDGKHSFKCSICGGTGTEDHSTTAGDDEAATCTAPAYCSVCEQAYGNTDPDNHASSEFTYTANEDGATHKKAHQCCGVTAVEAEIHVFTLSASGNVITSACSANCGRTGTAAITATGKTYDGTAAEATVTKDGALSGANFRISYALKDGESLPSAPVDAGTYTASIGMGEHEKAVVASVDFTIAKADPAITKAPTAVSDLTYTGEAQDLITAGDTDDGTMVYSLEENGGYSTAVPQGTNAGDYTVWYYIEGDKNHADGAKGSVKASIGRKVLIAALSGSVTKVYDGTDAVPENHGLTILLNGLVSSETVKVTASYAYDGVDVGVTRVNATGIAISGTGNYTLQSTTASADVGTITKADSSCTAPVAVAGLTYTGEAQALITAGAANGGTMQYRLSQNESFRDAIPTGTDAGTYTVYYKVLGDANHKDSEEGSVSVTIDRAKLTVTAEDKTAAAESAKPALTYTVTGLKGTDKLTAEPTLKCDADMKTAGVYEIRVSGGDAGTNYELQYVSGKLTVKKLHKVTAAAGSNGSVTLSSGKAAEGTQVTITVTPKSGYKLSTLTVKDAAGNSCPVSTDNNGKYYFTMPEGDVSVSATFTGTGTGTATADPTNPKTGDAEILWSAMAMLSLLGMAVLVLKRREFSR